ncbi:MAG: protein phosphatase 2C domain-containing protein [Thermodesulfobacteriota bacterium]
MKKMKIEYLHEQGIGCINEDAVFVNGNAFAVFDGATSLDGHSLEGGKTGGYHAARIASRIFQHNNDSLRNLAEKANGAILNKMLQKGVDVRDKAALWSTSAAVVRIHKNALEWLQTGDSLIMLIYADGSYKIPIHDYDHDQETLWMWKRMADHTDLPIHQALKDQIRKVRADMNISYGALNGERTYLDFLNSGTESLEGVRHILLFTDGLFIPKPDPGAHGNFDIFVDLFQKGGLPEVHNHVRGLELSDPKCRTYPRFKLHDDIAAVSVSL